MGGSEGLLLDGPAGNERRVQEAQRVEVALDPKPALDEEPAERQGRPGAGGQDRDRAVRRGEGGGARRSPPGS